MGNGFQGGRGWDRVREVVTVDEHGFGNSSLEIKECMDGIWRQRTTRSSAGIETSYESPLQPKSPRNIGDWSSNFGRLEIQGEFSSSYPTIQIRNYIAACSYQG